MVKHVGEFLLIRIRSPAKMHFGYPLSFGTWLGQHNVLDFLKIIVPVLALVDIALCG